MNLTDQIKKLNLRDMVVTNAQLNFFLYGQSDDLSQFNKNKQQIDKIMNQIGYHSRELLYERKIDAYGITRYAEKIKAAGVKKILASGLSESIFNDKDYLIYQASSSNFHEVVDAMIRAGFRYEEVEEQDGTKYGWFVPDEYLVPPAKINADVVNPFKELTDELATTLNSKNETYGNSFDKTLDKYGLNIAVARIEDKFNRLENIVLKPDLKLNDESPRDTLMDLAGYAVLLVKYMDARGLNNE